MGKKAPLPTFYHCCRLRGCYWFILNTMCNHEETTHVVCFFFFFYLLHFQLWHFSLVFIYHFWSFLIIVTKYQTKSGLKIFKWQDKRTKRHCQNILPCPVEGRLRLKKWKEAFLSRRWYHADFYILHKLQKQLFTCILQSSCSENF